MYIDIFLFLRLMNTTMRQLKNIIFTYLFYFLILGADELLCWLFWWISLSTTTLCFYLCSYYWIFNGTTFKFSFNTKSAQEALTSFNNNVYRSNLDINNVNCTLYCNWIFKRCESTHSLQNTLWSLSNFGINLKTTIL